MKAPLPEGMTAAHAARLARLSPEQRQTVNERAAFLWEATGCTWVEADRRAWDEEYGTAQRALFEET